MTKAFFGIEFVKDLSCVPRRDASFMSMNPYSSRIRKIADEGVISVDGRTFQIYHHHVSRVRPPFFPGHIPLISPNTEAGLQSIRLCLSDEVGRRVYQGVTDGSFCFAGRVESWVGFCNGFCPLIVNMLEEP